MKIINHQVDDSKYLLYDTQINENRIIAQSASEYNKKKYKEDPYYRAVFLIRC